MKAGPGAAAPTSHRRRRLDGSAVSILRGLSRRRYRQVASRAARASSAWGFPPTAAGAKSGWAVATRWRTLWTYAPFRGQLRRSSHVVAIRSPQSPHLRISALAVGLLLSGVALADAQLDPQLLSRMAAAGAADELQIVVSYEQSGPVTAAQVAALKSLGITRGHQHAHAADRRRAGDARRRSAHWPRATTLLSIHLNKQPASTTTRKRASCPASIARRPIRATSAARCRSPAAAWR